MTAAAASGSTPGPASEPGQGRHRGRRRPRRRRPAALAGGTAALIVASAAGYLTLASPGGPASADSRSSPHSSSTPDAAGAPAGPDTAARSRSHALTRTFTEIPGLGPATRAAVPASSRQVLVARGRSKDSSQTTAALWTRTDDGRWRPGEVWSAHNALRGWTRHHHVNDLRSPIGVFTLSDAGGYRADPGSALPYHRSTGFTIGGTGFRGEALRGSFDYVVAIDYNRVPGSSPLDPRQPMGPWRGGGIWLHVDHGGPTHGCVTLPERQMAELLRTLSPHDHPVIVMGDHDSLAK
ncbi:L,D-transpeptidase family protein [Wenjunlia tyrosinilytica]|uniref:L,D-TPase catalytic domain-containing protein n=1 Tax=Wenjunlia tyrosinilytica TaxID=1544741 RepID=A0A917ZUH4_9ACTN|nr:L,D-transpeptidase family protein [Wenjunlia tyrosinilytica]GGO90827.1 hypothetical protein GCM10012280_37250 [Wenjunlia tyrosinilytica]